MDDIIFLKRDWEIASVILNNKIDLIDVVYNENYSKINIIFPILEELKHIKNDERDDKEYVNRVYNQLENSINAFSKLIHESCILDEFNYELSDEITRSKVKDKVLNFYNFNLINRLIV